MNVGGTSSPSPSMAGPTVDVAAAAAASPDAPTSTSSPRSACEQIDPELYKSDSFMLNCFK